ncbi:WxL domain-containing protein [Enterococcus faecalis]|uniref:WxL domain-containing protein n=1 Tax=Enterococcus faecalis TaxID=1351 RepID=UPI001F5AA01D|nr:WxL domain-containing protein [Enterococcus faecalis]
MKKRNLMMMLGLSVNVLGSQFVTANGEEVEGNGASTNATLLFEENKTPTDPVIPPIDPTDPTDPNGPDKPTGNTEALRIDLAPNFHFGKFSVGSGEKIANNTRKNSNLQVTDGRGTLEGWVVSVSRTDFKNGDHLLPAALTLSPGEVSDGKNNKVELTGNSTKKVVVNTEAQPIFSANKNEGGGTYYQNFDGERATLAFNSNEAKKGLYNAEIKWTLTSRINEGAK